MLVLFILGLISVVTSVIYVFGVMMMRIFYERVETSLLSPDLSGGAGD